MSDRSSEVGESVSQWTRLVARSIVNFRSAPIHQAAADVSDRPNVRGNSPDVEQKSKGKVLSQGLKRLSSSALSLFNNFKERRRSVIVEIFVNTPQSIEKGGEAGFIRLSRLRRHQLASDTTECSVPQTVIVSESDLLFQRHFEELLGFIRYEVPRNECVTFPILVDDPDFAEEESFHPNRHVHTNSVVSEHVFSNERVVAGSGRKGSVWQAPKGSDDDDDGDALTNPLNGTTTSNPSASQKDSQQQLTTSTPSSRGTSHRARSESRMNDLAKSFTSTSLNTLLQLSEESNQPVSPEGSEAPVTPRNHRSEAAGGEDLQAAETPRLESGENSREVTSNYLDSTLGNTMSNTERRKDGNATGRRRRKTTIFDRGSGIQTIPLKYYGELGLELMFETSTGSAADRSESTASEEWKMLHTQDLKKNSKLPYGSATVLDIAFMTSTERDTFYQALEAVRSALMLQILHQPDGEEEQRMMKEEELMRALQERRPVREDTKPLIDHFLAGQAVADLKDAMAELAHVTAVPSKGKIAIVYSDGSIKYRKVSVVKDKGTDENVALRIGPLNLRQKLRSVPSHTLWLHNLKAPVDVKSSRTDFLLRYSPTPGESIGILPPNVKVGLESRPELLLQLRATNFDDRRDWMRWICGQIGVKYEVQDASAETANASPKLLPTPHLGPALHFHPDAVIPRASLRDEDQRLLEAEAEAELEGAEDEHLPPPPPKRIRVQLSSELVLTDSSGDEREVGAGQPENSGNSVAAEEEFIRTGDLEEAEFFMILDSEDPQEATTKEIETTQVAPRTSILDDYRVEESTQGEPSHSTEANNSSKWLTIREDAGADSQGISFRSASDTSVADHRSQPVPGNTPPAAGLPITAVDSDPTSASRGGTGEPKVEAGPRPAEKHGQKVAVANRAPQLVKTPIVKHCRSIGVQVHSHVVEPHRSPTRGLPQHGVNSSGNPQGDLNRSPYSSIADGEDGHPGEAGIQAGGQSEGAPGDRTRAQFPLMLVCVMQHPALANDGQCRRCVSLHLSDDPQWVVQQRHQNIGVRSKFFLCLDEIDSAEIVESKSRSRHHSNSSHHKLRLKVIISKFLQDASSSDVDETMFFLRLFQGTLSEAMTLDFLSEGDLQSALQVMRRAH